MSLRLNSKKINVKLQTGWQGFRDALNALLPYSSMLIIICLPFRGDRLAMEANKSYFEAGTAFYSTFSPEHIDGYYKKFPQRKWRKKDRIQLISDIPDHKIRAYSDSVCRSIGVPPQLVYEIGMNESRWNFIRQKRNGIGKGDLQVIDNTFRHWYRKLKLKGGHTRSNYLLVATHYLKHCYNQEKSWKKARFVYARGHWRDESTWSAMERAFMNKIDWSKYDKSQD